MRWDDLRAFIVLSGKKTFTHAAEDLEVSVATLTRKIDRLEADLSLSLVRRSPTGVTMTPEGLRILKMAEQGNEYFGQIERVASSISAGEMRDPIRISSTEPVIADILAPHVVDLYTAHPNIQLDLVVSTEVANLQRQEADLAVRLSRPREPSLVARKVGEVRFGLFAARSLVAALAQGESWRDLPLISFNDAYGDIPETDWIHSRSVGDNVLFYTSSIRAQLVAAKTGLGAVLLPTYIGCRESELIKLDAPPIQSRHLWLVFHRDMKNQTAMVHVRNWVKCACEATLG